MRRFEEADRSKFDQYIKLGKDNADCLRRMQYWCRYVKIEPVSGGLYAQMTGLPIATHSVGCPYVAGGSQSMNLHWIFSDFLTEHCSTCRHHTPNGDTSWGKKIIDDHLQAIQKQEQETDMVDSCQGENSFPAPPCKRDDISYCSRA